MSQSETLFFLPPNLSSRSPIAKSDQTGRSEGGSNSTGSADQTLRYDSGFTILSFVPLGLISIHLHLETQQVRSLPFRLFVDPFFYDICPFFVTNSPPPMTSPPWRVPRSSPSPRDGRLHLTEGVQVRRVHKLHLATGDVRCTYNSGTTRSP